jgi:predicted DsbA family dithiol-disulfide isomerase
MVTIDMVHDTMCPWCRIGKKNLDDALTRFEGEAPEIHYHPFLLAPGMPKAGRPFHDHLRSITGGNDFGPMLERSARAGAQVGLTMNWDLVQRAPNTVLSHAAILSAPLAEQGRVLDRIQTGYFEQGVDIGDKDALLELVANLPVDTEKLEDQSFLDAVAGAAEGARAQGVTGVPFFIFNQQLAVSGAQPADVLLGALRQAAGMEVAR